MKTKFIICFIVLSGIANAQYPDLLTFDYSNGAEPLGSLTLSGNKLYGMTLYGGTSYYDGCVFSINTNGSGYKDIHGFNDSIGGDSPDGSLTLIGNTLYGMTSMRGTHGHGDIFSIDTNGSRYKELYSFSDTSGSIPYGDLTLLGSKFYGMTSNGGKYMAGVIFSIDTNGNGYKDLHNFYDTVGELPASPYGDITIVGGKLFGMCGGGAYNGGCIFSIDTNGNTYKDIYDFTGANGVNPSGSLTLLGTKLFGMTTNGGAYNDGCIFSINTNGNGDKNLHNFNDTDGAEPGGSLILSGGKFYGMTDAGNPSHNGVVFSVDTNGRGYKSLLYFDGTNGSEPSGSLTLSGNELFGMTPQGGTKNDGVIFGIDTNSTASISNLTAGKGAINVYPNPNNGNFTIQISGTNGQSLVEIYNLLGEKVYSNSFTINNPDSYREPLTIDLSSQPGGVYLYRIISESGSLVGEGKLVIQR